MSETEEKTYRDDLNIKLEAILSAILASPLSEKDQRLLRTLQKNFEGEKLIPPPPSTSRSAVLIKLFWSELLIELKALAICWGKSPFAMPYSRLTCQSETVAVSSYP